MTTPITPEPSAEALAAATRIHPEYSDEWKTQLGINEHSAAWNFHEEAKRIRRDHARIIDAEFAALRERCAMAESMRDAYKERADGRAADQRQEREAHEALCARLERAEELLAKSIDEMDRAHKSGASIWCPDWHHVKSCREFLSAPSAKPGEGGKL